MNLDKVKQFYEGEFEKHGCTPQGAGWPSEDRQYIRFLQLEKVFGREANLGWVLDYGCGYGAFEQFLWWRGHKYAYFGYDICRKMLPPPRKANTMYSDSLSELADRFTYVVASGIFNVKFDADLDEWLDYVEETISEFDRLSTDGFAFNCLSSYNDFEDKNLFYWQPEDAFSYCMENFGPKVALLHDYGLWDFTIIVRKGDG